MSRPSPFLLALRARAAETPDAIFLHGSEAVSFAQALERVGDLANTFRAEASGAVVLHGPNDAAWLLAFLATNAAGKLCVPVNPAALHEAEVQLRDLLPDALVFNAADGHFRRLRSVAAPPAHAEADVGLLTSGSTGEPKLVLRTAESFLAEGRRYQQAYGFRPQDRLLTVGPLNHAFNLGLGPMVSLLGGGSTHLCGAFHPKRVLATVRAREITVISIPAVLARLACVGALPPTPPPQTVREIIVGAGPMSPDLEQRILRTFGRVPQRGYGSSESGALAGSVGDGPHGEGIGRPLPGVEVALADTTVSGPSDLFVRTCTPFLGYLTPDGLDRRRVSPDNWYATHDRARQMEDGTLVLAGRSDGAIRRGGHTIDLASVEAIVSTCAGVVNAVAIGKQDDHGDGVLEVHLQLDGTSLSEVTAAALARLPPFSIPNGWRVHEHLPLNANGKPDRRSLSAPRDASPVDVLDIILKGRQALAIAAAWRVGLFAALDGAPRSLGDLCDATGARAEQLAAFVDILRSSDLVRVTPSGDICRNVALSSDEIGHICAVEAFLASGPLSVESICRALRGASPCPELPERDFGAYLSAMGLGARRRGLLAARHLRRLTSGPILELGRPAGDLAMAVEHSPAAASLQIVSYTVPFATAEPEWLKSRWRGLFLHNTLRSLVANDQGRLLGAVVETLEPGSPVMVADMFLGETASGATAALQLDWLTLGGLAPRTIDDAVSLLQRVGVDDLEAAPLDGKFQLITGTRR